MEGFCCKDCCQEFVFCCGDSYVSQYGLASSHPHRQENEAFVCPDFIVCDEADTNCLVSWDVNSSGVSFSFPTLLRAVDPDLPTTRG